MLVVEKDFRLPLRMAPYIDLALAALLSSYCKSKGLTWREGPASVHFVMASVAAAAVCQQAWSQES